MPQVLVDARALQGPDAMRGVGRYVAGLLAGLSQIGWERRVELLVDAREDLSRVPREFRRHEVHRRYRGTFAGYEDGAMLGADLDRIRPGLFHSPWLRLPSRSPAPVVATLHDLIPWAWGGPWMLRERLRYWPGKRLLRRAEAVIAVSEASAADAVHLAGVERGRITVVPEGTAIVAQPDAAERVSERWGLASPYFLYVGALDRRKDPVGLVRAWSEARRAGAELDLVIAGGSTGGGRLGGARRLGHVTDPELADLYAAAACLLFPSRYEGFGLTALEAMACGCPVVAYDNSSIPEVVADAGVLVRDADARALGRAAAAVAGDPDRRAEIVGRARARATSFTWERTARDTAAVYKRLSASSKLK
jgi:glycosyltransferase involved in cell wall biosynthesis